MPNLLISTKCTGSCPFCFAQNNYFLRGDKDMMTLKDVERLIPFCKGEPVQLFGGEPTLNPELVDIVHALTENEFRVSILTNLMGDRDVYEKILEMEDVGFLVNVHGSEYCKDENLRNRFFENIDLFKRKNLSVSFGCTIYSQDQSFDYLYKLAREDNSGLINHLRMSPSVPTKSNKFMFPSEKIGEKILEIVENLHRINPKILLGMDCPCFNYCMFSKETYGRIRKAITYFDFCHSCQFMMPIEIFPDYSALYAYCLQDIEELRIKNIFDFENIHHLRKHLSRKTHQFEAKIPMQCDFANCDKLECKGQCLAFNYFMRENRGA